MFKPELWQSHDEYRTLVSVFGRRLSRIKGKFSCRRTLELKMPAKSGHDETDGG